MLLKEVTALLVSRCPAERTVVAFGLDKQVMRALIAYNFPATTKHCNIGSQRNNVHANWAVKFVIVGVGVLLVVLRYEPLRPALFDQSNLVALELSNLPA